MITYNNSRNILNQFDKMIRGYELDDNLKYRNVSSDETNNKNVYYNAIENEYITDIRYAIDGTTEGDLANFTFSMRKYKFYMDKFKAFNRFGAVDSTDSIFESRLIELDRIDNAFVNAYAISTGEIVKKCMDRKCRATDKIVFNRFTKLKEFLYNLGVQLNTLDEIKMKKSTLYNLVGVSFKSELPLDSTKAVDMWCEKAHQFIMENVKIAILLQYEGKYNHLLVAESGTGNSTLYKLRSNSMQEIDMILKEYVDALKALDSLSL